MLKRIAIASLILGMLSACGVLSQAPPLPSTTPTSVALSNTATSIDTPATPTTPTVEPTATAAPDLPSIWVLDGALERQVALDPQTGKVLNEVRRFTTSIVSRDGQRQYLLAALPQERHWQVSVLVLDLTRSASPKRIPLTNDIALTNSAEREVSTGGHLLLSTDSRRLFVTQLESIDEQWHTRVYVVDLADGMVRPLEVFSTDRKGQAPWTQTILAADERQLYVVQNAQRQPPVSKNDPTDWFTRIAILNLGNGSVERVVEVPGDIQAHGFGLEAMLAPNGQMLYLLQTIVRNSAALSYRFVAFDTGKQAIALTQLAEQAKGDEAFAFYRARFTPDGRYLATYYGTDGQDRPEQFRFLDTQTGLVTQKFLLERMSKPSASWDATQVIASADSQLVYVAFAQTREVFVFDLAQRKVVRHATLSDTKSTTDVNPLDRLTGALSDWIVGRASAKMYPQPGAILSADGQRLYFADVQDFDKGNGLWAVETGTLKTIGHWLTGKDIYGIQLSADERELYAANPNDNTLYVLDALTGEARRALKLDFKPVGFVTAQPG